MEMSKVEDALRVRRFDRPPSPEAFASHVEPANVPAVFSAAVSDWDAVSKWNPFAGGLDYLEERVGSTIVEVMLSKCAPVFYGDLRRHERVPLPFSAFISSCKSCLRDERNLSSSDLVQDESDLALDEDFTNLLDNPDQLYLAQVPILNLESKERCQLEALREDIQTPIFLKAKLVSSINLWMTRSQSKSSAHYDPHHNLLCVVSGCKQVLLWPPSASPLLYPLPIYGEASNHSAVDVEHPDMLVHPRAKDLLEYSQKVILHSGDALFIPEGWFHQVDSDDLTIAVNFWWKSSMMSDMLEHMDSYYLRRILNRLVEKEKNQMLQRRPICRLGSTLNTEVSNELPKGHHEFISSVSCGKIEKNYNKHDIICQLDSAELFVLHKLISLVHDTVNVRGRSNNSQSKPVATADVNSKIAYEQNVMDNLVLLENDPIASIFGTVEPLVLRKVLLAMVHHFPRTLEALILHVLSPIAAELLTQKFDEMDQETTREEQCDFYQLFYNVFDDQYAAMDAILNGKELFSFEAFRNVLEQYLGADIAKPKLLDRRIGR